MNFQLLCSRLRPATNMFVNLALNRSYAKPGGGGKGGGKAKVGKAGPIFADFKVPVEKDPQRLVDYVCGSNIYVDGEDVKIKPDSEYPDWLWELRTGPPPPLEEMDPNTRQYWKRVRTLKHRENLRMLKLKKRITH